MFIVLNVPAAYSSLTEGINFVIISIWFCWNLTSLNILPLPFVFFDIAVKTVCRIVLFLVCCTYLVVSDTMLEMDMLLTRVNGCVDVSPVPGRVSGRAGAVLHRCSARPRPAACALTAVFPLLLRGRLSRVPAPPPAHLRLHHPLHTGGRTGWRAGRSRSCGRVDESQRGESRVACPLSTGTGEPRGTGTCWTRAALPVTAHRMQVTAAMFCFYYHYYHIAREAEFVKKCNLAC